METAAVIRTRRIWARKPHLPSCFAYSSSPVGSSGALFCPPSSSVAFDSLKLSTSSSGIGFHGRKMEHMDQGKKPLMGGMHHLAVYSKRPLAIGKQMRWWENGVQPNMREVESVRDLVVSLVNSRNQLVVVDFFSPGCGACRALHPKICQFAEMNPDMMFLEVNYEEHRSMCYSLNVHVLPFFRFYRGAQGRLCSFSCTVNTINKFKDAMAKHNTARCSLGPAKGLEESELSALGANKELNFSYTHKPEPEVGEQYSTPGSPQSPVPSVAR